MYRVCWENVKWVLFDQIFSVIAAEIRENKNRCY